MKKMIFLGGLIVPAASIGVCSRQKDEDVLKAAGAGWHAKTPPSYPQTATFTFMHPQQISQIGFLPQLDHVTRFPRKLVVEISDDAHTWKEVVGLESWKQVVALENDCKATSESWPDHPLGNTVNTNNVCIKMLSI